MDISIKLSVACEEVIDYWPWSRISQTAKLIHLAFPVLISRASYSAPRDISLATVELRALRVELMVLLPDQVHLGCYDRLERRLLGKRYSPEGLMYARSGKLMRRVARFPL